MKDSFLFLTDSNVTKSGEVVTKLVNVDEETLKVEMPSLLGDLKEQLGTTLKVFKTFSVLPLDSFPIIDKDFEQLKPCLFSTVLLDTHSSEMAWSFEADYNRARNSKNGALRGFCTNPMVRFWTTQ